MRPAPPLNWGLGAAATLTGHTTRPPAGIRHAPPPQSARTIAGRRQCACDGHQPSVWTRERVAPRSSDAGVAICLLRTRTRCRTRAQGSGRWPRGEEACLHGVLRDRRARGRDGEIAATLRPPGGGDVDASATASDGWCHEAWLWPFVDRNLCLLEECFCRALDASSRVALEIERQRGQALAAANKIGAFGGAEFAMTVLLVASCLAVLENILMEGMTTPQILLSTQGAADAPKNGTARRPRDPGG